MYAQLKTGTLKKTLNKHIKVRYCARYNAEGLIFYMYRKNIKIEAIDLNKKVGINYQESAQIESNTTSSGRFISSSYDSRGKLVFHQAFL